MKILIAVVMMLAATDISMAGCLRWIQTNQGMVCLVWTNCNGGVCR